MLRHSGLLTFGKHLKKQLILVVDDLPDNIELLRCILHNEYQVVAATKGQKALELARSKNKPDMILLDVVMPDMNGYEVCKQLKQDPRTSDIPVIFITGKDEATSEGLGFKLGAVDYISKPVIPLKVLARVKTHLAFYDQSRELERLVNERTEKLHQTRLQIIHNLGRAAEYKDNETGMHIIRMSNYARILGEAAGMSERALHLLYNAAPMHDVGKIGIPDNILLKPGKLNKDEWQVMKTHCAIGAEIIGESGDSELLQLSACVALTHHEKWDGNGYPNGLKGDNIPFEGRIVAIADVFDALTSVRPYKKAWAVENAMDLLFEESGKHFDPNLVPLFKQHLPEILEIKEKYSEV